MDEYILYFLKKDSDKKLTRLTDLYSTFNIFAVFFLLLFSVNTLASEWIVRLVFFCLSILCVSVELIAIIKRGGYIKKALSVQLKAYETEDEFAAYQNYYNKLLPAVQKDVRIKGIDCTLSYIFFAVLFGIDLIQLISGIPSAVGITMRIACILLVFGVVAWTFIGIFMSNKRHNLVGKQLKAELKSVAPNIVFSTATLKTPDPERYFFSDAVTAKAHFHRKKVVSMCAMVFGAVSMICIFVAAQTKMYALAVSGGIFLALVLLFSFILDFYQLNHMKTQIPQNPQNEVEELRKKLFYNFYNMKKKFLLASLIGYTVLLVLIVVHNVISLFIENGIFLVLAIFYGIAFTVVYFIVWMIIYRKIRKQAFDAEWRIDELTNPL